ARADIALAGHGIVIDIPCQRIALAESLPAGGLEENPIQPLLNQVEIRVEEENPVRIKEPRGVVGHAARWIPGVSFESRYRPHEFGAAARDIVDRDPRFSLRIVVTQQ